MTGPELEPALQRLSGQIEYPVTPDLAAGLHGRLAALPRPAPARQPWRFRSLRVVAVVAAAILLVVGATLAAIPGARSTLAHWFGIPGVVVNTVPSPPSVPLGSGLNLGNRTTESSARQQLDFAIKQPQLAELGVPDAIYLRTSSAGKQVSLLYRPRPGYPGVTHTGVGLLISEFRGTTSPFMGKLIYSGSNVKEVTVNGQPGYWIQGEHAFFYEGPNGEFEQDTLRLSANALLWSQNGVTYRIEGNIDESKAMAVASSMP